MTCAWRLWVGLLLAFQRGNAGVVAVRKRFYTQPKPVAQPRGRAVGGSQSPPGEASTQLPSGAAKQRRTSSRLAREGVEVDVVCNEGSVWVEAKHIEGVIGPDSGAWLGREGHTKVRRGDATPDWGLLVKMDARCGSLQTTAGGPGTRGYPIRRTSHE